MTAAPEWMLAVDARNVLGEGPVWDSATHTLLWVDIVGGAVQRLDPASGRVTLRRLDAKVSAVVPRAGGGLAVALPDGIWVAGADQARKVIQQHEQPKPLPLREDHGER